MKGGMVGVGLALALLAGGCGPGPSSVILYWDFQRHTLTPAGDLVYDASVNVGGGDASCAESRVDTVTITDESGRVVNPEFPDVPCVFAGVQGVRIQDVRRGRRSWTVTGYQGDVATFVSAVELDVREGVNQFSVTLGGIPDDLDLLARFRSARGVDLSAVTCAQAGVARFAYSLVDDAGTEVAAATVPCTEPAGLFFRLGGNTGLDRGFYRLRWKAFRAGSSDPIFDSAAPQLVPNCQWVLLDHFGTDTGPNGFDIALHDVSQGSLCVDPLPLRLAPAPAP